MGAICGWFLVTLDGDVIGDFSTAVNIGISAM
jgi:hypothetical protein